MYNMYMYNMYIGFSLLGDGGSRPHQPNICSFPPNFCFLPSKSQFNPIKRIKTLFLAVVIAPVATIFVLISLLFDTKSGQLLKF